MMKCKTGDLGYYVSVCENCGHLIFRERSCRNRNCPNCQAVQNEEWIDARRSEVIDGCPYFHVVFTIPAELNSLVYANQKLLYSQLHKCVGKTLLELSADPKYFGAVPGIIQLLHTWGQELNYHPHIHCIVSGAGLAKGNQLKTCGKHFFLPEKVAGRLFKGKFLASLESFYQSGKLVIPNSCKELSNPADWSSFKSSLYKKEWYPDIRETFNGQGNAIDYLGRYAHRIAITNARIKNVTNDSVTFTAKDYKNNSEKKEVTLSLVEFIRRFLMHVLPSGFQKIRYYGFLNNRNRKKNLKIIFRIQGHQKFVSYLAGLSKPEKLKVLYGYDVQTCPICGCQTMQYRGVSPPLQEQ